MRSCAKDLRDYTVAQAILTDGVAFYGQDVPSVPDDLAFFRDTPSFDPQEFLGTTDLVETCGLQVLVRDITTATGQTRVDALYDFLRKINHVTIAGTRYQAVRLVSPPFALGRDADDVKTSGSAGRAVWSLNFLVTRDRTT
jgi:hypothetical protein